VVLGVLSVFGGWLNLPALIPIGPVGALEHWLDPVVEGGALRVTGGQPLHLSHGTEIVLVGIAVAIAVAGIALAFMRLKPERLVPKSQSPEEHGFGRVLENKYYVDEIYDAGVVQPVLATSRGLLWRGIDVGLIDGMTRLFIQSKDDDSAPGSSVRMGGLIPRTVGMFGSFMQSGQVGTYAWVLVVGMLVVLGAFTIR
jgi:NADH-quinone oxidoreductase subunit L